MDEIKISLPDGKIATIPAQSDEGLKILRHSTSHIMAQAVQELFEGVKISIGPSTKDGFYYDFDYEGTFSSEDFPKIEARMQEIVERDLPFIRKEVSKEEAFKLFQDRGEVYKVELIHDIPEDKVTIYRQEGFVDLCRGPHLVSTGYVKAFKLTSIAGAYWRGDEKNKMLQRIYGTSFPDQGGLDNYLQKHEEAKKRDHRKLGKELDLFSIKEEAGAGLIIYHPKGALLRTLLEDFEKREHLKRGYQIVIGPQLLKLDLWKKSGHFDNYRENMYFTEVEGQTYGIKPMNCLAHMLVYRSKIRSYRDLPLRYFELGTVHRHEKSGVLHGLLRTRQFTQDDAHILCTPEQLNAEIKGIIEFIIEVMKLFGFEYEVELSTRPEKSIGTDEDWEKATFALKQALEDSDLPYDINEGEGAFYGPKIDMKLKDCLERSWQCATIQCDFTLPERFDLNYIGKDGREHRPVMLHRVIIGALERFMGILIEHYGGAFPVWLSPVQAIILTITDQQIEYAEEIFQILKESDIRVKKDIRNEKLGLKVREAQLQKTPYLLILGNKEMKEKTVSVRKRGGRLTEEMTTDDLVFLIKGESRPGVW
jgi:threonyl-tRNA synthetase